MRRYLVAALACSVVGAWTAGAQDMQASVCPAGSTTAGIPNSQRVAQDACQQAYDVFQFMAPQLGAALAGGNTVLGSGGTLGGLGHFSIGLRGNVFRGQLPDVTNFNTSVNGVQRQNLASKNQVLGLPTAEAAVGVFRGIPLGVTNVGGVDLLVSATYIPEISEEDITVTPDKNLQLGFGARVGLIQESLVVPGVSVSYLRRDLPSTTISATVDGTSTDATLTVRDAKVKTSSWRLTANKTLLILGLAAGVGQDKYDQSADISGQVTGTTTVGGVNVPVSGSATVPGTAQSLTRTNMFVDVMLNLPFFKIVGEAGRVSGGEVATYNSFAGGRADRAQTYFSAGIRIGF
jgi:hypothetical protein